MYLSRLQAENFRLFGSGYAALDLTFQPGLTVLVGPNDAGKSAVLDAIRLVVGTTAADSTRLRDDDFHYENRAYVSELRIMCRFDFADWDEAAPFFEHLTPEDDKPVLYLTLVARRDPSSLRNAIVAEVRSGRDADGPRLDAAARQLLQATYLRALRDALAELSAGRGSRLSKILANHPKFKGQEIADYDSASIVNDMVRLPKTLRGIMALAEDRIEQNDVIVETRDDLNKNYLEQFSVVGQPITGQVGIARQAELKDILEKLDLWIASAGSREIKINRGLGTNNILFMATEFLLLRSDDEEGLPLLLIEEPEAHLHPQLQLLVSDFLEAESSPSDLPQDEERKEQQMLSRRLQIVLTTHSPTLASKISINQVVIMHDGHVYPLNYGSTKLTQSDYRYLRNFLDATRANLFFARAVIVVEGDAENLLLPAIFEILGKPLAKFGISIVRVGSRGLMRYAHIFQGANGKPDVPIRVACIADLDPKNPQSITGAERKATVAKLTAGDGGPVKTFVADYNTFEYDLAYSGLDKEVHEAALMARYHKQKSKPVEIEMRARFQAAAQKYYDKYISVKMDRHEIAGAVYAPLKTKKASKADAAQYLAEILRDKASSGTITANSLWHALPQYLRDAITWLTEQ